jgi:hypothetical protein
MALCSAHLRPSPSASTDRNKQRPNSLPGLPHLANIDGELPLDIPNVHPPGLDQTDIWDRVLLARLHQGSQSASSELSLSLIDSFVSESDSDADAQPEETPCLGFNCATYGISPDMRLREKQIVDGVTQGEYSDVLRQLKCLSATQKLRSSSSNHNVTTSRHSTLLFSATSLSKPTMKCRIDFVSRRAMLIYLRSKASELEY